MVDHVPKGLSPLFLKKKNSMIVSFSMRSIIIVIRLIVAFILNGFCFQVRSCFDRVFACHIVIEVVLCSGTRLCGSKFKYLQYFKLYFIRRESHYSVMLLLLSQNRGSSLKYLKNETSNFLASTITIWFSFGLLFLERYSFRFT